MSLSISYLLRARLWQRKCFFEARPQGHADSDLKLVGGPSSGMASCPGSTNNEQGDQAVKVMKAYAFLSGLLFVSSVAVNAQEKAPTPQVEVGLTYGFARVNPGGNAADFTQNGGSGQVEYNINKVVGL